MEGMVLAAGAGTRLRPLTNRIPKALVEVGGRPILASVIERMVDAGISRIIINTHHHEDQIRTFLRDTGWEGLEIAVSSEPEGPLDTGGGSGVYGPPSSTSTASASITSPKSKKAPQFLKIHENGVGKFTKTLLEYVISGDK